MSDSTVVKPGTQTVQESAKSSEPEGLSMADWTDIFTAFGVAIMLYAGLLYIVFSYDREQTQVFLLAGMVGVALGWVVGILISPYRDERSTFAEFGKLVYGFLSGWLVSKLDKPIGTALEGIAGGESVDRNSLMAVGIALTSFLISVVLTYVTRHYWTNRMSSGGLQQNSSSS